METVGERIKKIREMNNLTSQKFAERLLCDRKTIQRYENNLCMPDAYNLQRIAGEFKVSTDYILGISDTMYDKFTPQDINLKFQRYKKMMTNPIIKDEEYYWIRIEVNNNKHYISSLQTESIGFTEDSTTNNKKEIRKARPVIPENVIKLCKKLNRPVVILNKISDIGFYFLFGGEAIIRRKLCEEQLPEILEPIIVNISNN